MNKWAAEVLEEARAAGGHVSALTLARCYWQLGKSVEAQREFRRAIDRKEAPETYLMLCLSAVVHPPEFEGPNFSNSIDVAVGTGEFRRAADQLATATQLDPGNDEVLYREACVLAYLNDAAYLTTCRVMHTRFGSTVDRLTADRIAKACLLLPDAETLEASMELVNCAVSKDSPHVNLPWFQITKGLAEYRSGRSPAAIEWTNKGRSKLTDSAVALALADLVEGMAHRRLGNVAEADACLKRATGAIDKLKQTSGWENLLICRVLQREAESLIGHADPQSQPSTQSAGVAASQPVRDDR